MAFLFILSHSRAQRKTDTRKKGKAAAGAEKVKWGVCFPDFFLEIFWVASRQASLDTRFGEHGWIARDAARELGGRCGGRWAMGILNPKIKTETGERSDSMTDTLLSGEGRRQAVPFQNVAAYIHSAGNVAVWSRG